MNRFLAYFFVGLMLLTVVGQAFKLQSYSAQPITEVKLYESRLLAFLIEIQSTQPHIYDSILLNLSRIQPATRGPERYRQEEITVAQTLLQRLTANP